MRLSISYLGCKRLAEVSRAGTKDAGVPPMDHVKISIGGAEAFNRHMFLRVSVNDSGNEYLPGPEGLDDLYDLPGEWWFHGSALKLVKPRQVLVLDTATRVLSIMNVKGETMGEVPDKARTTPPGAGHESTLWPVGDALINTVRKGKAGLVTFGLTGKVLRHIQKLLPTRAQEWHRIVFTVRPDQDGNVEGLIEIRGDDGVVAVIAPVIAPNSDKWD